jgi:hypothetical protein
MAGFSFIMGDIKRTKDGLAWTQDKFPPSYSLDAMPRGSGLDVVL